MILILKKHKAFSLYEFLVVFFIIGLISAMTLPTVKNYAPSWKISTNSKIVLSKLRQAQEESVTTQNQHAIRFDTSTNPVKLQFIKFSNEIIEGEETVVETVLGTVMLDSTVTLEIDPSFTSIINEQEITQVIFSADGGPSTQGNIVVRYSDRSKTINILASGIIKIL